MAKKAKLESKIIKYSRPNWDEYFLGLIEPLSRRATCDRGRSSAIIVSDKNTILTTGYVGSAPGDKHCDEAGHLMVTLIDNKGNQSQHCVRTLHAEENAILQAAMDGIALRGATLYCKMTPCINCARRIARVGIKRVVAQKRYHADAQSRELFKKAKVKLDIIDDSLENYDKQ
ncbi:MAG: cytidine/deoxycytidylate deaminase family protein [Candidatus Portnoybacteria bacterium]|nr:cytidine/deoxycytidylate deaminase family protein [Candidatus Portnoybacteria bacterium]MDD4982915.1 cytidine/deoxycytidylate deaminase family protein [Candidatus Portnoybacteria bacterium]